MRYNPFVLFQLKLYMFLSKQAHQIQIFRLPIAHMKIKPRVNFQATSQFSFKYSIAFQCHNK